MIKQLPISARNRHQDGVQSQYSALCFRQKGGKCEILLITSRRSGRWIIPKGWPIEGLTPARSAAQEAWEEAGVTGKPYEKCIGLFSYQKILGEGLGLPCLVLVYPLKVKSLATEFPEVGQRRRKWFSTNEAASHVQEPELARILRDFDPKSVR